MAWSRAAEELGVAQGRPKCGAKESLGRCWSRLGVRPRVGAGLGPGVPRVVPERGTPEAAA